MARSSQGESSSFSHDHAFIFHKTNPLIGSSPLLLGNSIRSGIDLEETPVAKARRESALVQDEVSKKRRRRTTIIQDEDGITADHERHSSYSLHFSTVAVPHMWGLASTDPDTQLQHTRESRRSMILDDDTLFDELVLLESQDNDVNDDDNSEEDAQFKRKANKLTEHELDSTLRTLRVVNNRGSHESKTTQPAQDQEYQYTIETLRNASYKLDHTPVDEPVIMEEAPAFHAGYINANGHDGNSDDSPVLVLDTLDLSQDDELAHRGGSEQEI
jgi:hypothetical protein